MTAVEPQRRRRSVLLLLVVTSITLLSLDYQGFGPLASAESGIRGLLSPLTSGAGSVTSPLTNAWEALTEYDEAQAENEQLRERVAELENLEIGSTASEETLRALLDELGIDYLGGAPSLVAQIIERPGNLQGYALQLDRGARDGVQPGMPVMTASGLAGRVTSVDERVSEVRLLHQPDFKVGVRIVGTGAVALANGEGLGEPLTAIGIDQSAGVEVDDAVVTSGIEGSSYPPDMPIGRVSDVEFDEASLQTTVFIEPVADLTRLRWVTVLLWTVDGGVIE